MVVLSLASIVRYCFTKLLQKKRWNFYEKKKKVAKIIAIMMTLLLFYNFEGSITAYAHGTSTITSLKLENNGENVQHADEQMINVQSVELDTNIISNDVINKNDRQDVQKTYCINETSRYAEDESENTDPNYALLIEDENVVQGTLTEQGLSLIHI